MHLCRTPSLRGPHFLTPALNLVGAEIVVESLGSGGRRMVAARAGLPTPPSKSAATTKQPDPPRVRLRARWEPEPAPGRATLRVDAQGTIDTLLELNELSTTAKLLLLSAADDQ